MGRFMIVWGNPKAQFQMLFTSGWQSFFSRIYRPKSSHGHRGLLRKNEMSCVCKIKMILCISPKKKYIRNSKKNMYHILFSHTVHIIVLKPPQGLCKIWICKYNWKKTVSKTWIAFGTVLEVPCFFKLPTFFLQNTYLQRLTSLARIFLGFLVKIIPSKFISDLDFNKTKTIVCKRLQLDSAPLHRCHRPYPNLFLRFRDLLILCLFYFDVTLDFQASAGCFFCLIRWVWLSQIVLK